MDKHKCKLILYALLTAAVMIGIFVLSAQTAELSSELSEGFLNTALGRLLASLLPRLTEKGIFNDIRKYAHLFEYFCLGVTSCLFFTEWEEPRLLRGALHSAAFSVFYACTDELHQIFVPGRAGQIADVCIDATGIVLGAALVFLILKRRIKSVGENYGEA